MNAEDSGTSFYNLVDFIWNTSWVIFRLMGMTLKQYLPGCVLNVVSNKLSCVRWMLQKLFFVSNLKDVVEPTKLYVISSSVGDLRCSQMKALLKSFGSGNTLRFQFDLWG